MRINIRSLRIEFMQSHPMTRLDTIEHDIATLSLEDLARFRDWFASYDAKGFDERITTDALTGRLDAPADGALRAFRSGVSKPL